MNSGLELIPARQSVGPPRGEIVGVEADSPAWRAGVRTGDRLVAIDGLLTRDVIDYQYETGASSLPLTVERDGELLWLEVLKEPEDELGLQFSRPVFEGIRECNNNPDFCFIRGLPKGLRRSLYIRDDDYRYSYLFGNFLTLTNLGDADWRRIAFQKLSPLWVSVHATDPDVRRRMLANPSAPPILEALDRLGRAGVDARAQIVLCPGLNDGEVLDRTIRDLSERADWVDSAAVVPVGLTRYSVARTIRPVTPEDARAALEIVERWQRELRPKLGRGFVYASDELYQRADRKLPSARAYDGFPQLLAGVGLIRAMLADWARVRRRIPASVERSRRVLWMCGQAAAPALRKMASELVGVEGLKVEVVIATSSFFGGSIAVSGLITGADVLETLKGRQADLVILPRTAFGFDGSKTLDEWTVEALEAEAGLPLRLALRAGELLELTVGGG
jgi:putative radical SAM enzyme (TIGR03279 family)